MMYYAPCHPDCLGCVCKDLPEDHPQQEVVRQAHTPPTDDAARAVGKGSGLRALP